MNTRFLLLVASLGLFATTAAAQASLDWTAIHSGSPDQSDGTAATCVVALPSGGLAVGYTTWHYSFVYPYPVFTDLAADVVRWSADGQKLWTVRIPGATAARAIAVDPAGAIYFGTSNAGSSQLDCLDGNGVIQWSDSIPGSGFVRQLAIAPGGDVVAGGNDGGSLSVARWRAGGTLRWVSSISPSASSGGDASWLGVDAAGNSFVAGYHNLPGSLMEIAKLDSGGGVLWTYGVPGYALPKPTAAIAPDGDVVFGLTRSFGPPSSTKLVRLAPDGTVRWETEWSFSGGVRLRDVEVGLDGVAWTLGIVEDDNFIPPANHAYVRRFDTSGVLLSEDIYDPPERDLASPVGLVRGAAGQMYAAVSVTIDPSVGYGYTETAALQYDSNGVRNWVHSLDAYPSNYEEQMSAVVATPQLQLAMAGKSCGSCSHGTPGLVIAFDIAESPQAYCAGKTNSLGCTPAANFVGLSSSAATSGFSVGATGERNNKPGMLLYSVNGPASTPFQGGTLCVLAPIRRTPPQNSGGSTTGNDCTGQYSLDMNAFAHGSLGGSPHPGLLAPGTAVWCQAWGRDPGLAPPNGSSLSNGLRYVVLP